MSDKKKDTMMKDALILCAITLILGAILAGVYTVTKKPIEDAQAKTNNEACQKVVETGATVGDDDAALVKEVNAYFAEHDLSNQKTSEGDLLSVYVEVTQVHKVTDKDKKENGRVYLANAKKGYGGNISFALGVNGEGKVTGISITSESETAGLGANCENADWQKSFAGKVLPSDPAQNMYNKNEETDFPAQPLPAVPLPMRLREFCLHPLLQKEVPSNGKIDRKII